MVHLLDSGQEGGVIMLSDYEMYWAEIGMNEQDLAEAMGEMMAEDKEADNDNE